MSEFFQRFAGFPELVDYRQDQLLEVYRAIESLKNIETNDPTEVLNLIRGLDPQRVHRMYQNKCNEHQSGNRVLSNAIRRMSFRSFKPVIGDSDYV